MRTQNGHAARSELKSGTPPAVLQPLASPSSRASRDQLSVVVIESKALLRDCITCSLRTNSSLKVLSVSSVGEWLELCKTEKASLIVLYAHSTAGEDETRLNLEMLAEASCSLPVVILADYDSVERIIEAIDKGVRGYIPTDMKLEVAIEAIKMVNAGGTFVPASSLLAAYRLLPKERQSPLQNIFTTRQAAVVEALRMGKANKAIAYELNMRESTVKVHVRNIMKRLKARNRTQVAFLASQLIANGDRANGQGK